MNVVGSRAKPPAAWAAKQRMSHLELSSRANVPQPYELINKMM